MIFNFKVWSFSIIFIISTLHLNAFGQTDFVEGLPSLNVFDKWVSLSGFSSGGTMAQMLQIAHSSLIHGIAVFSHTYYRCGRPSGLVDDYDQVCTKLFNFTNDQLYNPERVHRDIATYYQNGYIDNPENLRNRFLYVYTGLRNFIFSTDQSLGILNVYERYIKNPSRIKTRVQDAELVMPTNGEYGVDCTQRSDNRSFIGNCGFSGAYDALHHLHKFDQRIKEVPMATGTAKANLMKQLKAFDQREFLNELKSPQMDSMGYYFVPKNCETKKCLLHFYFHGCLTGRQFEETKHIEHSGFLEIANANDIIVIFPQAATSEPENAIGCWDTFGISGPLYATKQGDQIIAVKRILDRAITSDSDSRPSSSSDSSSQQSSINWPSSSSSNLHKESGNNGQYNHFRRRNGHGRRQQYKKGYGYISSPRY